MKQFFKSKKFKLFAFVLCALLAGALFASVSKTASSPFTSAVSLVFSPIQKASSAISQKLDWFTSSFANSGTYKTENEELKKKIATYESQLADYDEMKHKISSYENMLGVKQNNQDFKLCRAEIIGTDSADMFSSLIINKGKSAGVSVNDPVISGNYVVGIIKKVNPSYSVVETLLNPELNVSAIESKTRETSYVTTDIENSAEGRCIFAALPRTTAVSPGGMVLTSGIGGVYPKGLVIGTVTRVCESEYDLSDYAIVEPGTDIKALEDVYVITEFEGQGVEQLERDE